MKYKQLMVLLIQRIDFVSDLSKQLIIIHIFIMFVGIIVFYCNLHNMVEMTEAFDTFRNI